MIGWCMKIRCSPFLLNLANVAQRGHGGLLHQQLTPLDQQIPLLLNRKRRDQREAKPSPMTRGKLFVTIL
jgi:hypothetical protein